MSNNPKCHTTDKTFNFAHDATFRTAVATAATATGTAIGISCNNLTNKKLKQKETQVHSL